MSDLVQSDSPPSNDEDTSTTAPLENENEDLEQGLGPQEVEVITVDMKSPSDSPGERPASRRSYDRRPTIHDTSVMDELRHSLHRSRHGDALRNSGNSLNLSRHGSLGQSGHGSLSHSRNGSLGHSGHGSLSHSRHGPRESSGSIVTMATRKSSNDENEDDEEAQDEEETETDAHSKRFQQAIIDACHDAFGVIGVDVWLHDEEEGGFHHAPGGYYRNKNYRPKGYKENLALERIEDENCVNFVPPTKQVPGAGLAGEFSRLMCNRKAPSRRSHRQSSQTKVTSGRMSGTALTSWERTVKTETSGATRPPSSTTPTSRRTLAWPC